MSARTPSRSNPIRSGMRLAVRGIFHRSGRPGHRNVDLTEVERRPLDRFRFTANRLGGKVPRRRRLQAFAFTPPASPPAARATVRASRQQNPPQRFPAVTQTGAVDAPRPALWTQMHQDDNIRMYTTLEDISRIRLKLC